MCKQLYAAVRAFPYAKLLILLSLLCTAVPLCAQTSSQSGNNQTRESTAQNGDAHANSNAQPEANGTHYTGGTQFGADETQRANGEQLATDSTHANGEQLTADGTQQEADDALHAAQMQEDAREAESGKKSNRRIDFMIVLGPAFLFNKEAKTESAPSPVVFPVTFGVSFPNNTFVSFQPRLSFFVNYYLWSNSAQIALPAEVENRTATSLSFLVTLPAVFSFHVSRNSALEVQAGLSALMRFAILAHGVSAGDSGASGNAGSDVKHINKWFWGGARWLYIDTGLAWLYQFSSGTKIGPEARFYFPLGSLFTGRGVDAFIASAGIKVVL
ncbi:MAG: hypothetical protein J6I73_00590 [Treponema sp.]|nr:hypothetical protein [Treponema sp.]